MNTTQLLNLAAFPSKNSNVRRKKSSLFDTITLATGTTLYRPFTTSPGNIFLRNQPFPLSGQQIFWMTSLSMYLQTAVNSVALYTGLIAALQHSNIEVVIDSKQYFKIPLLECLSFNLVNYIGTSTPQNLKVNPVTRNKNFIIPILFNASSNVVVNLNIDAAFASAFNASNLSISFNGILTDKLDSELNYNPQQGKDLQDIAFTCYDTQQVTSANQTIFNFFAQAETNPNDFSRIFPLSATERFEIQSLEAFVPGNSGATDLFSSVLNQRSTNYLTIKVDDVTYYESQLKDFLSTITNSGVVTFGDATPTLTNLMVTDLIYQRSTLEIPVIIPAQGKVSVQLQQPGSSLNVNQYITLMLKGLIKRQVN